MEVQSKINYDPKHTAYSVLIAIACAHFINDLLQAVLPAIYPIIKDKYQLDYQQIGLITFVFQITSSLFQPLIGLYTDKRPAPYSFLIGTLFTMAGIITLSFAFNFTTILIAAATIGFGSSIFHPEASKLSFHASGGKRGMAQSIFQIGGNSGTAFGPFLIALIVIKYGQSSIIWFAVFSVIAIIILTKIGAWYKGYLQANVLKNKNSIENHDLPKSKVIVSICILLVLIFSKYFYTAAMTNFYTFYMIDKFNVSTKSAQIYLFIYLAAVAAGTFFGGPIGDKIGRKYVIWFSILGVAPFTLILPHVGLTMTVLISVIIGLILSSAFSAILVYAQELLPGNIGMVSGLFFGFAFGMGGIGSAVLGYTIEQTSLTDVFFYCSFLPLLGIITVFLPNINKKNA